MVTLVSTFDNTTAEILKAGTENIKIIFLNQNILEF